MSKSAFAAVILAATIPFGSACQGHAGGGVIDETTAAAGAPGTAAGGTSGDDTMVERSRGAPPGADGGPPAISDAATASLDGGTGALAPLVTMAAACEMRADRTCARLAACAPYVAEFMFGKPEICRERSRLACLADAAAAESGLTSVGVLACAAAYETLSCADLLARRDPAVCRIAGRRGAGKSCGSHVQCESGFCVLGGDRCGVCGTRGAEHAPCDGNDRCQFGLLCGPAGTCVKPRTSGDACDFKENPCETQLGCVAGHCAEPLSAGKECLDPAQCDRPHGQLCVPSSPDAVVRVCGPATVAPPAADGAACGPQTAGLQCLPPARCVANQCQLGTASGC